MTIARMQPKPKPMPFGWSCAIVIGSGLLLVWPVVLSSVRVTSLEIWSACTVGCSVLSLLVLGLASRWLPESMLATAMAVALVAMLMIYSAFEVAKACAI